MQTLLEVLRKTEAFFRERGVPNARLDAEWLFAHRLGCKRLDLYLQHDRPLSDDVLADMRTLVKRRAQREPLQHIVGYVDFGGLRLKCDARALIPRPETEELLELLLHRVTGQTPSILDLGTGTGALALSLAKALPESRVLAVDASAGALALARENLEAGALGNRVTLLESNWFTAIPAQTFDLIVSNPPYLSSADWDEAQPEVKHFDPKAALVAKDAGLGDARSIIAAAPNWLTPAGLLALETGSGQHAPLADTARAAGFSQIESLRDTAGHERFLLMTRAAQG